MGFDERRKTQDGCRLSSFVLRREAYIVSLKPLGIIGSTIPATDVAQRCCGPTDYRCGTAVLWPYRLPLWHSGAVALPTTDVAQRCCGPTDYRLPRAACVYCNII